MRNVQLHISGGTFPEALSMSVDKMYNIVIKNFRYA